MAEYLQGQLIEPDFEELNQTEEALIAALNDTWARFTAKQGSEEEYRAALRRLNEFAARKPLPRQRMMGLD